MMKLSEAIRLGAMLKPQAFGDMSISGSCALQSAAEALGLRHRMSIYCELPDIYPHLESLIVDLPDGLTGFMNGPRVPLIEAIYTLNDIAKWTRERIADWVETIEREQEAAAAPEPVCCSTSAE